MSTTRIIYVHCDGAEGLTCDEDVSIMGGAEVTEAKVRAEAARLAWQRTKGLDLCPRHRTDTLINALDRP